MPAIVDFKKNSHYNKAGNQEKTAGEAQGWNCYSSCLKGEEAKFLWITNTISSAHVIQMAEETGKLRKVFTQILG